MPPTWLNWAAPTTVPSGWPAQVLEEYDQVTALASPGAYDPALIVGAATRALDDDDLLADVRRCARFVAVDDAQEMTPAVAELLAAVVGRGGELLLAGDPDAATLGFRGADPAYLVERADEFAAPGPDTRSTTPTIVLRTCWRHGPEIRAAVERVVTRVGTGGRGGQRRATPAPGLEPGQVGVHLLRSGVQEASDIAGVLRRAHLQRELPWGDMAVIVRGSARVATMRRVLSGAGVPVQVPVTEVPVRDESAVAPLLDAFEVALELSAVDARPDAGPPDAGPPDAGDPDAGGAVDPVLDPARAVGLLTSPIGGADAVALRRLRRALRAEERAGGGGRASGDLLVEAILAEDRVATLPAAVSLPARRVARVLAAGRAAAARDVAADGAGTFAAGVTAETVLWAIWEASRLAEPWRRTALAGGPSGARADRDLDAVVALFDAAARFVDRLPQAGPAEFLEHLRSQEVPGDTLVERAPATDAVALLTPQGAAGREWRLVVVAGVQVGVGRTPGCAGRCWARRLWSTSWPAGATARPRRCGRPSRRSVTRSCGSFTSRSAERVRRSSSPRSPATMSSPAAWSTSPRRWKPLPPRRSRRTTTTKGRSPGCPARCPCRRSSPAFARSWRATTHTPPTPPPAWLS